MGNKKDLDMKTVMYNDVPGWLFWTLFLLQPSNIAFFYSPWQKNYFLNWQKIYFFPTDKKYLFPTMAVPSQVTHGWWHIYQKCTKLSWKLLLHPAYLILETRVLGTSTFDSNFLVGFLPIFFGDFFLLHPAYLILKTQDLGTSIFD